MNYVWNKRVGKVVAPDGYTKKLDGKVRKGNMIYFSPVGDKENWGFRLARKQDYGKNVHYYKCIIEKIEPVEVASTISDSDFNELKKEYVEVSLGLLTDDITIDPNGDIMKGVRLEEIEKMVGNDTVEGWNKEVTKLAIKNGYASGRPFVV